jgi:hypothetical protein
MVNFQVVPVTTVFTITGNFSCVANPNSGIQNSASGQSCDQGCKSIGLSCKSIGTDIYGTNFSYMTYDHACYAAPGVGTYGCSITMNNLGHSCPGAGYNAEISSYPATWTYCNCVAASSAALVPTPTPAPLVTLNQSSGITCNTACSNIGRSCASVGTDGAAINGEKWSTRCNLQVSNCAEAMATGTRDCSGHIGMWTYCRCVAH